MTTAHEVRSLERPAATTDWSTRYAGLVAVTDLLVLVWIVFGTQIAWLGVDDTVSGFSGSRADIQLSYTVVSTLIIIGWMAALQLYNTRTFRVLGAGPQEYRAVGEATLRWFSLVAIVAFLFRIDLARGYVLLAFPIGLLVLVFSRWMWRQWLGVQRRQGQYMSRVMLVGSSESVATVARELASSPEAGYQVLGACVPAGSRTDALQSTSTPVLGDLGDALTVMRAVGADTIVVTSADELDPSRVRTLSWGLVAGREHLVVAPSLVDIGGPRISTRPVAGLPLIHVETPRYEGRTLVTKRAFDILVSTALLVVASPVLLVIAALVKLSGPGPVLYRQERIGRDGEPFQMLKFRSMVPDADARLSELLQEQGRGDTPLFKIDNDPRITPIGAFLRKHSLDELPQLLNVVKGDMSLVGPRPQREGEVELYDQAARRRLIVQPGMTGLWQVSGRSSLPWEAAIRLDLYYVENWSLAGDLVIMLRTFGAVVSPGRSAQ